MITLTVIKLSPFYNVLFFLFFLFQEWNLPSLSPPISLDQFSSSSSEELDSSQQTNKQTTDLNPHHQKNKQTYDLNTSQQQTQMSFNELAFPKSSNYGSTKKTKKRKNVGVECKLWGDGEITSKMNLFIGDTLGSSTPALERVKAQKQTSSTFELKFHNCCAVTQIVVLKRIWASREMLVKLSQRFPNP